MTNENSVRPRLAFVGMSGAGKSFWAKRLAELGYHTICCDDLIEERLRAHLPSGEYTGINGVAAWMGWPDSAGYEEREAKYLAEEIAVLDEVLSDLGRNPAADLVLDTTGSVIYTGNNLLIRLRRRMSIVHFASSPHEQQLLIERYLADPKPVLWRGAFQPKPGESPRHTVARCYPALIAARRQSYEALAHCTLAVKDLHDPSLNAEAFLAKIRRALARPLPAQAR